MALINLVYTNTDIDTHGMSLGNACLKTHRSQERAHAAVMIDFSIVIKEKRSVVLSAPFCLCLVGPLSWF